MDSRAFQSRLRKTFDSRLTVEENPVDHCMVVWDKTRTGVPYPVMKVACEHNLVTRPGTPREAHDCDIRELQRRNWAEKYGGRPGAAKEIMDKYYRNPQAQLQLDRDRAVEDAARGEVRERCEWRFGIRNSISMAPNGNFGSGGMKNRHHDDQRRRRARMGV